MSTSFSAAGQHEILAALHRLSVEREQAEKQMRADFDTTAARIQRELSDSRQGAIMKFQFERDSTQREFDLALAGAQSVYETRHQIAEDELRKTLLQLEGERTSAQRKAKKRLTEENWEANTVFEATQNAPQLQFEQEQQEIIARHDVLRRALDVANRHLAICRLSRVQRSPLSAPVDAVDSSQSSELSTQAVFKDDPAAQLNDLAMASINHLESFRQLQAPRLWMGNRPAGFAFLLWLVCCGAGYLIFGTHDWTSWIWLIAGTATATALAVGSGFWLFKKAVAEATPPYQRFHQMLAEGDGLRRTAIEQAKKRALEEGKRILERRDRDLKLAKEKFDTVISESITRHDAGTVTAHETRDRTEAELVQTRDASLAETNNTFPKRLDDIQQRYQRDLRTAQTHFEADANAMRQRRDQTWNDLAEKWRNGMAKVSASVEENLRQNKQFFPTWNDPGWNIWQPATAAPPSLRFGQYHVDLTTIPGAISSDDQLNGLIPTQVDLPALLPFPQNASLLFKASGEGRRIAIEAVQAIMLRMLTSIPPGKVRFTIVDPVGLGENFAGFMHLADYDEQSVTNRIWTEPNQIEARLSDLTEQMENVIQKYLRNEFRSIDEYNAFAGEVAEPFRVLVVANFPVNFTETAARRLTSIATSGARCGVYVLMINDVKLPLPPQFDLKDVERSMVTLNWNGKQFVWQHPSFEKYPLQLDRPPAEEQFNQLVHIVGRGAKAAKRVEVPFDHVAPPKDKWWTGDTAGGIRVPLGRAGATKLQYLDLGQGTSQHALIAGKTGSGKSTFLHALITNLGLIYSPEQIEMYLIDFKKGVEFKTYATHLMPHARVIAIESEREFGLSVIEKLDGELKRRGDLFRQVGVQDVAGYRAAVGSNSMPRILLIVDEFQELFTEDDKLAQDAALLLDRLVRQGRAFGMHVLLGSQTLGGAYSLARSTLGQMAVRIALQCSEADAHLILSEENSAARLLSRPGEAIYNDSNGTVQGNHPFQVVWLGEERREQYLAGLRELTEQRVAEKTLTVPPLPIVFEGNKPADIRNNRALADLLRASDWPVQSTPVHAWLGDAIAIKDPTAAVLRPQSGDNLLIVGQRAENAVGMLASAMLSLAAQHRPRASESQASSVAAGSAAKFYILEHDRPADLPLDKPLADYRGGLAAFSTILPHPVQSAGRRDLPALLAEVAQEVNRRQSTEDTNGHTGAIYLLISDLGRFRDLRRDESDMGFSYRNDEKRVSPSLLLGDILRDGPSVGVYTLAWCDSFTAVQRSFDRQAMREFALRVLLQMSANDSSHLIDSPTASRLGPNVALFHNEEEGRLEKFRPYAWPPLDWLATVQQRFNLRLPVENV
jgi:DNA segregation ATPase FtsK/SpoIIIE, S-DNA-T family